MIIAVIVSWSLSKSNSSDVTVAVIVWICSSTISFPAIAWWRATAPGHHHHRRRHIHQDHPIQHHHRVIKSVIIVLIVTGGDRPPKVNFVFITSRTNATVKFTFPGVRNRKGERCNSSVR